MKEGERGFDPLKEATEIVRKRKESIDSDYRIAEEQRNQDDIEKSELNLEEANKENQEDIRDWHDKWQKNHKDNGEML